MAGGHVEFEAPRTEVIKGSTAKPMPILIPLESLIAAGLSKVEIMSKGRKISIGPCRSYIWFKHEEAASKR